MALPGGIDEVIEQIHAKVFEKRDGMRSLRDGLGLSLPSRRAITCRATSHGGQRQYLQLGP